MATAGNGGRDLRRTIDAVWRIEAPALIAGLTRLVRDVGLAEDLAQDALVVALETWPRSGVPDNPGAWLMATAKHRAIDGFRRDANLERKQERIAHELERDLAGAPPDPTADAAAAAQAGDDVLGLIFMCCHPLLSIEARVALTLRLLGGLTSDEIARAFLTPRATVQQRIARAKRTLSAANVPFEVPAGEQLAERLPAVLGVIYLVFNEGYSATAGEDWVRPELCEDAQRLGRVLAALMPREPEVHGLLALMELHASRLRARRGPDGAPVLLNDQDRSRWDLLLIGRGLKALDRAQALSRDGLGPYALQAAIAACHARARTPEQTDWERIVALYDGLVALTDSPVVELNRAVAVAMAFGPAAGLELVDGLADAHELVGYHLLPSVRADLLERLGRREEAYAECTRAAGLTANERERTLLLERAAGLAGGTAPRRRTR